MKAELKPATLAAFDAYMRSAEARLRYDGQGSFLWVDAVPERRRLALEGKALAEPWTAKGEIARAGWPDSRLGRPSSSPARRWKRRFCWRELRQQQERL